MNITCNKSMITLVAVFVLSAMQMQSVATLSLWQGTKQVVGKTAAVATVAATMFVANSVYNDPMGSFEVTAEYTSEGLAILHQALRGILHCDVFADEERGLHANAMCSYLYWYGIEGLKEVLIKYSTLGIGAVLAYIYVVGSMWNLGQAPEPNKVMEALKKLDGNVGRLLEIENKRQEALQAALKETVEKQAVAEAA